MLVNRASNEDFGVRFSSAATYAVEIWTGSLRLAAQLRTPQKQRSLPEGVTSGCASTKRNDSCRTGQATTVELVWVNPRRVPGVELAAVEPSIHIEAAGGGEGLVQAFRVPVQDAHGSITEVNVCPLHARKRSFAERDRCAISGRGRSTARVMTPSALRFQ